MDKNAIKKYAIWARNELIAKISQKAAAYGIEKDNIVDANADSIDGIMLSSVEKKQRKALIEQIKEKGYEQVIEEVAYTWFNRFTAIRFMEVNGYLPSHIRVFTDDDNNFKPQILTEAIHLNDVFEKINMEKVLGLKQEDKTEELYKYLLIIQCNALSAVLPRMFQKIEDYSELLLPDYLLREGSVLEQLVTLIPEQDWQDQVQIIGWLYQYYNSEPKDAVFAALKKNVKISKENIPAATQLFTPDWIVRYMVENSLGRLWLEGHPNDELKSEWKYYLDEAEQEEEVQEQLDEIRKEYAQLKPEEIKCIDPCMGSGHILCYMFDVLVKIYEDYGYTARDAASSIVEKNLWGLDIDERAAQLSYFAVMMKARQYDRRFLTRGLQPHVYAIEESNGITSALMHDMGINLSEKEYGQAVKETMRLVDEMHDAKEYGSIIDVTPCDWDLLRKFAVPRQSEDGQITFDINGETKAIDRLNKIIDIGRALSQRYHITVTNPPYMGSNGADTKLLEYIKINYPDSKSDLFSVFIEKCCDFTLSKGYYAMITQPSILFLTSFVNLRNKIINDQLILSLLHMGRGIFGVDFGSTAFVLGKEHIPDYKGVFFKLHERTFQYIDPFDISELYLKAKINHEFRYNFSKYKLEHDEFYVEKKHEERTFSNKNQLLYYEFPQDRFLEIKGMPMAFWLGEKGIAPYEDSLDISKYITPMIGMVTGDTNRFLRYWYEVGFNNIGFNCHSEEDSQESGKKWFPYQKGGNYRRWYGNNDYVVNWLNKGYEIKYDNYMGKRVRSHNYNGKQAFVGAITWSSIASGKFSARMVDDGFLYDVAGPFCQVDAIYRKCMLAYIISKVADFYLSAINPTINFVPGTLLALPLKSEIFCSDNFKKINELVDECIEITKCDWDSFENSWDFKSHPLIPEEINQNDILISEMYKNWESLCNIRYNNLKRNEEKLNSIFIDIFNLGGLITPEVEEKDLTIRIADLKSDIKSFISYAVGCMFGRYSLDFPGLVYAGGEWDSSKYKTFKADADAIIPISDDEYFEDDIVNRFITFVQIVYGESTVEENLQFIANSLGKKGTAREIIRNYFINEFYSDHVKVYQKRPIYWLFDSGKKNGFKCLVYMHRYHSDTIARIRTDYVHEQQSRYRTALKDIENRIIKAATSEKVKLNRELSNLNEKAEELRVYEEKIHHIADQMIDIDLDDGVKVNYAKFQDVLAKLK